MCGIVGAVSHRNIVPVLVEGLKRLEYRGYDSCGVAVYDAQGPKRARSVSRVAELDTQVRETALSGFTGIAHTRWATHGAPATHNAHPHFSPSNESARIALVHNGIIENHDALRVELIGKGYVFISQTDTEVIAHLIDSLYDGDLFDATRAALKRLQGAYSVAVFCSEEPHRIVGARDGSPLILGCGTGAGTAVEGECFLASDAMALAGVTNRIVYLEDGDAVDIQLGRYWITDRDDRPGHARGAHGQRPHRRGRARPVPALHAEGDLRAAARHRRHARRHRPGTATRSVPTCSMQENDGRVAAAAFAAIDSVLILACGTSYYSGLTAKYWLESVAKIPTQVEVASEYRYRDSVPEPEDADRRHQPVGRDRRHAGRAEAREVARPHAHARDLQRRHVGHRAADRARLPDARRRRGRRGVDQGVHDAALRAVPAVADARQAARPSVGRKPKPPS